MICNACAAERPEARACFGAAGPAPAPTYHVRCDDCLGTGCARCVDGAVFRFDCPRRLHDAELEQLLPMWVMLRDHGVLPDAGGYLDQSAWTMDAFRLIAAQVHEHEATT